MASEANLGSHINPDAAAMTKREYVDDNVGGGDGGGVVDRERLSRRVVVSNVNKIFDPLGLLAPTTIKYKSLLQRLVNTGLERGKPLQGELAKEEGAVRQETKLMKGALRYLKTGGLLEEQTLPGNKPFTMTCLDFMDSVTVKAMVNKRAKTEVYPLLLVCQDTGAVHTQVAYDYSTSAFLIQWDDFVAKRGRPIKVVSDRGSQLTSSGNTDLLNWDPVEGQEAERETA